MKIKRLFFSIILSFSVLASTFAVPTSEEVRTELSKLLVDPETTDLSENIDFWDGIIDFLSSISPLLRVVIIAAFAGIILFLGYTLAKYFNQKKYAFDPPPQSMEEVRNTTKPTSLALIYSLAMEKADQGDYDTAILLLHQYSVQYLFKENILQHGREYTNREIKWLIKNKEGLYDSFYNLALESEKIAFNEEHRDPDIFENLHQDFKREFLKK